MTLPIIEVVGSRETNVAIDNPSKEVLFTIVGTGATTDEDLIAACEANLQPSLLIVSNLISAVPITVVLQSYRVKQEDKGGPTWHGSAMYGKRQPRQTGDLILSFDGTGGTAHVTTSKTTQSTYKRTGSSDSIPDFQNAIGCNGETVEGVDITIPVFKFVYEWYPPANIMTQDYILGLMALTGQCNDDTWKGFGPGEVLFLGPTGAPRGMDDWEVKLHFLGSPNVEFDSSDPDSPGLTVGQITHITKSGHDYLWVRFSDEVSNSVLVKQPQFAYVERLYDRKNFGAIGIGT